MKWNNFVYQMVPLAPSIKLNHNTALLLNNMPVQNFVIHAVKIVWSLLVWTHFVVLVSCVHCVTVCFLVFDFQSPFTCTRISWKTMTFPCICALRWHANWGFTSETYSFWKLQSEWGLDGQVAVMGFFVHKEMVKCLFMKRPGHM